MVVPHLPLCRCPSAAAVRLLKKSHASGLGYGSRGCASWRKMSSVLRAYAKMQLKLTISSHCHVRQAANLAT